MTITLSAETQKLLEERMKAFGFDNPDDAVRAALQNIDELDDDRSPETLAAVQRGLDQAEAGQSSSWDEFRKELAARRASK
jgi:Arc/MetJ-type ribon-helix-helix transcriptional regulator